MDCPRSVGRLYLLAAIPIALYLVCVPAMSMAPGAATALILAACGGPQKCDPVRTLSGPGLLPAFSRGGETLSEKPEGRTPDGWAGSPGAASIILRARRLEK